MKSKLNRQSALPPPKEVLWVERLKGSERGKYTVYSPHIDVFFTHWIGRTVPCYSDHSRCEGGHAEREARKWPTAEAVQFCTMCNLYFQGRRGAKTCSPRCRARRKRVVDGNAIVTWKMLVGPSATSSKMWR